MKIFQSGDPDKVKSSEIDILFGSDVCFTLLRDSHGWYGSPVNHPTILSWVPSGLAYAPYRV